MDGQWLIEVCGSNRRRDGRGIPAGMMRDRRAVAGLVTLTNVPVGSELTAEVTLTEEDRKLVSVQEEKPGTLRTAASQLGDDGGDEHMPGTGPIRVMIVDDHRVVRSGLKFGLLAFDDLELVAEVESGEEALTTCQRLEGSASMPEVILMDMVMPGVDGAAATRALLDAYPDVHVLVLTGFNTSALIHEALQAGASGYLLKNASIDHLAGAIRAARAGRVTLAPEVIKALEAASPQ
jgi:CheY-like chemotaxis protein